MLNEIFCHYSSMLTKGKGKGKEGRRRTNAFSVGMKSAGMDRHRFLKTNVEVQSSTVIKRHENSDKAT